MTPCHILDFFGKRKFCFIDDLVILDDIDSDLMVDKTQGIQINLVNGAFDLDDVFFSHLITAGVLDDGDAAVKFIQIQILIDLHTSAGLDMVQYKTFVKSSDT